MMSVGGGEKGRERPKVVVKRDFFGRPIAVPVVGSVDESAQKSREGGRAEQGGGKVWVMYHEGFSNAVRKPITLAELVRGM